MTGTPRALTVALALALCGTLCGDAVAKQTAAKKPPSKRATLTVDMHKLRNDRGKVVLALFNNKAGYPHKPGSAYRRASVTIKAGKARARFRNLKPGTYAVAVFHDENGDGKLERSWIGSPKEGTGASNDAKGSRGPPTFKDAKFTIGATDKAIRIKLRY